MAGCHDTIAGVIDPTDLLSVPDYWNAASGRYDEDADHSLQDPALRDA